MGLFHYNIYDFSKGLHIFVRDVYYPVINTVRPLFCAISIFPLRVNSKFTSSNVQISARSGLF